VHHGPYTPEGQGLDCRAGRSSAWINWRQILTPCVAMETPRYDLKQMPCAEAWQKLTADCRRLPSHQECAGCQLRAICNVCYEEAIEEKTKYGKLIIFVTCRGIS
jgi:radical SAM protein with 4Fe4S-binding SPASM domain